MRLAEITRALDALWPPALAQVWDAVGLVCGDPDTCRVVRRLGVCGGAGDELLGQAAAAGADVMLTSDLRHHRASEAPEGLALLDAAHWATEWPWLPSAAARVASVTGVATSVSTMCTDPWSTAVRSPST